MKISVITVCYNSIATLQDTLESILRQTYPDVESIVVDGASKDGTVELIEKYSHQFSGRMKWLSEPDKGIYDAMNKGIGMATGDVIGFLNADDYYQDENVLKAIARAFAWHGTDAVHGNLHYINGVRDTVRTWRGTEYNPGSFQRGWSPAHPTFYCKKGCFIRYGGFDPSIGSAADFELMLRFIEKNRISTLISTATWYSCALAAPAHRVCAPSCGIRARTNRHSEKTTSLTRGIMTYPAYSIKSCP